MLAEIIDALAPAAVQSTVSATGQSAAPLFVDCTFGAGGHTRAILERIPRSRVIALDADPQAYARARALADAYPSRLTPVHANFSKLADALESLAVRDIDGIMYDLGLSSLQLADAARGFAFAGTGELDMRLDPTSDAASAAQLLATPP